MRWALLFLGLLFGVAPGEASGERIVAGSKGLAGSASEMHAGIVREGHHLARPKLPSPIVAPARHGGVAPRADLVFWLGPQAGGHYAVRVGDGTTTDPLNVELSNLLST